MLKRSILLGATLLLVVPTTPSNAQSSPRPLLQGADSLSVSVSKNDTDLQLAQELFSQRKYEDSVKKYTEVIERTEKPNQSLGVQEVMAHYGRGKTYFALNHFEKAIADFDVVIKHNPKAFQAYLYRGLAYAQRKDLKTAIEDFKTARKIEPRNAAAREMLERAQELQRNQKPIRYK